jgi:hypothetical protein
MSATTTLSTKFRISIPKGAGVLLVPVPDVDALFGSVPGANPDHYRERDDR